jgi:hypothetical protein
MPRDGSGNYTLPGGINPVISGTTIDVAWANPTLADVATALTDSLSRTGSGGMLVPFLNADGAVGSPGISWVNETTSGLYRAAAGDQRFSTLGTDVLQITGDANNPLKVFSNAMFSDVVNADLDRTIGAAWTFTALQSMAASAAPGAGINLGVGVAPSAPVNGDLWIDGTSIFARVAGVTQNLTGSTIVAVGTTINASLRWTGAQWDEFTGLELRTTSGGSVRCINTLVVTPNMRIETASANDYGWFSGFNNIVSFNAVGTVDTFNLGGFDTVEFDGPSLKMIEQVSVPGANEGSYGQLWYRFDADYPYLILTQDDGDEVPLCEQGGFTLDWSDGFSDSNDNDYRYIRIGNFVSIHQVGSNLGNSNAAQCSTSDGVPVALRPTSTRYPGVGSMVDNGSIIAMAQLRIGADGILHALVDNGATPLNYGDFWTTSGVKGPNAGLSFCYNITDA